MAGLTFSHGREEGHEQQIVRAAAEAAAAVAAQIGKAAEAYALRGDKKPCKETVYFERILQ